MGFLTKLSLLFIVNFQIAELCNPNATNPLAPSSPVTTPISSGDGLNSSPTPTPSIPTTPPENESIESYEHIVVSGLPFQRGESYGQQAKKKIQMLIAHYKRLSSMPSWQDCITLVHTYFIKSLQFYYPNGLEEMKGIAKGANVTLEDIIILNARHELVQWKKSRTHVGEDETPVKSSYENPQCNKSFTDEAPSSQSSNNGEVGGENNFTDIPIESETTNQTPADEQTVIDIDEKMVGVGTGGVVLSGSSKYAHVLMGQNWDAQDTIMKKELAILLEVHPDPCEGLKPFVMIAEAGQLGLFGFNADGLGIIGTNLWSSRDAIGISHGDKSIPSLLFRRMFVESSSFSAGLQKILKTPRYASTNLIIATAEDEALNIELTPIDYFITRVPLEREYLAQSNHFKSSLFFIHHEDRSKEVSSLFRDRRVERKLAKDWPRINEKSFQSALKDHVGSPDSVCLHGAKNKTQQRENPETAIITVASGIINLSQRTLLLAKGPPCQAPFKYFKFEFSQL